MYGFCNAWMCCLSRRDTEYSFCPNPPQIHPPPLEPLYVPLNLCTHVSHAVSNNSEGRKWLRTQFDKNFSCFYVELPEGSILLHLIEENEKFPAQFGREVRFLISPLNVMLLPI